MTSTVKAIAVMGAGAIGARHVEHIVAEPRARLHAIVDQTASARALAARHQVPCFPTLDAMMAQGRPDGIVIATPNTLHAEHGLAAVAQGLPILLEKPLTSTLQDGERLVAAADRAGVPLLTGHHRRHNPIVTRAKETIAAGKLGKIVAVHCFFWLLKPDPYFDEPWRRKKGAGPVLMNLSHDIDLIRHFCGEIASVQAMENNAVRGHEIEDAAVVLLRFVSGALGTVNISDAVVAPWSWEHTASEHEVFPRVDETCLYIAGTHGSLSIPQLGLWTNPDAAKRGWHQPFVETRITEVEQDPLRLQIQQFIDVIEGKAQPLVSGRDGLQTLRVIDAVKRAAQSGLEIKLG